MSIMLRSKNVSFRLVPASALIAIAAVCWSPVASAGPLSTYLSSIGVNTTTGLTNNDRPTFWTPTAAGVAYEIVDNQNGTLRPGAGQGGQNYDLEALYVQRVGNDLKITGVAGGNPLLYACPTGTGCPAPYTNFGMGDFFIGSMSGNTYSPKVGVETTGQYFKMNSSGYTESFTSPLKAGALVNLSGSVTTSGGVTGGTDAERGWERGLPNWSYVPAPSQIYGSGLSANTSGATATMVYERLGKDQVADSALGQHYIYQATITNFAALGLGDNFTVHWGEICGNDWLRTTTADVPLPSSLALFLLGGAGLAAGTRRRKV
jgi:hypothetical protein